MPYTLTGCGLRRKRHIDSKHLKALGHAGELRDQVGVELRRGEWGDEFISELLLVFCRIHKELNRRGGTFSAVLVTHMGGASCSSSVSELIPKTSLYAAIIYSTPLVQRVKNINFG